MEHGHVALLVEDDRALRDLCAIMLASEPIEVLAVDGWEAALAALDSPQPLCAVIADYSLQDGTGAAVIREARERRPQVGGLLITGHAPGLAVDEGVNVLHKPFGVAQFQKAANDACVRGCEDGTAIS